MRIGGNKCGVPSIDPWLPPPVPLDHLKNVFPLIHRLNLHATLTPLNRRTEKHDKHNAGEREGITKMGTAIVVVLLTGIREDASDKANASCPKISY